jgi:hypothetical protein
VARFPRCYACEKRAGERFVQVRRWVLVVATSTSRSASPELPPPSGFFGTATPLALGWALEHVVENDTFRVNLRKSETTFCGPGLEKLSRAAGVGIGMVLVEAWGHEGRSS